HLVRARVTSPQTVLDIAHHPRAVAGALAPNDAFAKIHGFHRAFAVVVAVALHVAVVEATASVEEITGDHRVLCLGVVALGGPAGVVVAIADAWHDVHAVHLVSPEGDRQSLRVGFVVGSGLGAAHGRLREVISLAG